MCPKFLPLTTEATGFDFLNLGSASPKGIIFHFIFSYYLSRCYICPQVQELIIFWDLGEKEFADRDFRMMLSV